MAPILWFVLRGVFPLLFHHWLLSKVPFFWFSRVFQKYVFLGQLFHHIFLYTKNTEISKLQNFSTAQHGTARHGTARHGTARHCTALHGTARHGTAQHGRAVPRICRERMEADQKSEAEEIFPLVYMVVSPWLKRLRQGDLSRVIFDIEKCLIFDEKSWFSCTKWDFDLRPIRKNFLLASLAIDFQISS